MKTGHKHEAQGRHVPSTGEKVQTRRKMHKDQPDSGNAVVMPISSTRASSESPRQFKKKSPSSKSSDRRPSSSKNARSMRHNSPMNRHSSKKNHSKTDSIVDIENQSSSFSHKSKRSDIHISYRRAKQGDSAAANTASPLFFCGRDNNEFRMKDSTKRQHVLVITLAFAAVATNLLLFHVFIPKYSTSYNNQREMFELMGDNETRNAVHANHNNVTFKETSEHVSVQSGIEQAKRSKEKAKLIVEDIAEDAAEDAAEDIVEDIVEDVAEIATKVQTNPVADAESGHAMIQKYLREPQQGKERPSAQDEGEPEQEDEGVESILEQQNDAKTTNSIGNQVLSSTGRLLANWEESQEDFCYDCDWGQGQSCVNRILYLMGKYKVERDNALRKVMTESERCLISSHKEENEKLSRFCFECTWGPTLGCGQRVEYLVDTYGNSKRKAMLSAMEKPTCVMSEERAMEMKQKIDTLLEDWDTMEWEYCADCESESNISCQARVGCLRNAFEFPPDEAKAMTMAQYESCRRSSHRDEEEKLKRFCAECEWGMKQKCGARVIYLVNKYHNPERRAKLAAMERPSCVRSEM